MKISLGEICELKYGYSLPERARNDGAVPVYGSNGIVGHHDQYVTNGETIIVGRKGSAGKVQFSGEKCFPIDTTYFIDETIKKTHLKWLYYCLSFLDLSRLNKAAAVPGVNRNDVYRLDINYPVYTRQKEIARILDDVDNALQLRREANALTDRFLQSTFLSMFGDPVSNPKGWDVKKIADMGIVKTGNTPPRDNKANYGDFIEWIKTDNIIADRIHPTNASESLSQIGLQKGRSVSPNSVLITCIAGSPTTIGNVALTDRHVAFNQQINSLTPNKNYAPLFVYFLFKMSKRKVQESTTKGMKRIITKSVFENLELIAPPIKLQQQFADIVTQTEELRKKQRAHERELEQLFQGLLQRYFG